MRTIFFDRITRVLCSLVKLLSALHKLPYPRVVFFSSLPKLLFCFLKLRSCFPKLLCSFLIVLLCFSKLLRSSFKLASIRRNLLCCTSQIASRHIVLLSPHDRLLGSFESGACSICRIPCVMVERPCQSIATGYNFPCGLTQSSSTSPCAWPSARHARRPKAPKESV